MSRTVDIRRSGRCANLLDMNNSVEAAIENLRATTRQLSQYETGPLIDDLDGWAEAIHRHSQAIVHAGRQIYTEAAEALSPDTAARLARSMYVAYSRRAEVEGEADARATRAIGAGLDEGMADVIDASRRFEQTRERYRAAPEERDASAKAREEVVSRKLDAIRTASASLAEALSTRFTPETAFWLLEETLARVAKDLKSQIH